MNVKISVILALLLSAAATVRAASLDTLTVAVYDFADTDRGGSYGGKVTTLVTADLTDETNLVMLERAELKKALSEQAFGVSGMVSSDAAAKIGELTGVKVLVSGQVIRTAPNHVVIVANIVGTETGRLFAEKTEGPPEKLMDLTSELSQKIARNIRDHKSSFVQDTQSHGAYLEQIVKGVKGTKRPGVITNFHFPDGPDHISATANTEMGIILQKAGFTVLDAHSDRKPDIEISGIVQSDTGAKRAGLFPCRSVVEAKVQERQTGRIIIIDRQVSDAIDIGSMTASRDSIAKAVDELAARILPLLAEDSKEAKK